MDLCPNGNAFGCVRATPGQTMAADTGRINISIDFITTRGGINRRPFERRRCQRFSFRPRRGPSIPSPIRFSFAFHVQQRAPYISIYSNVFRHEQRFMYFWARLGRLGRLGYMRRHFPSLHRRQRRAILAFWHVSRSLRSRQFTLNK